MRLCWYNSATLSSFVICSLGPTAQVWTFVSKKLGFVALPARMEPTLYRDKHTSLTQGHETEDRRPRYSECLKTCWPETTECPEEMDLPYLPYHHSKILGR